VRTDTGFGNALDESRRENVEIDHAMRASIDQMVESVSSASARRPKVGASMWRRPIFLLPTIGVLAIATTAGAVAYSFSKSDATVIPINYTTSSGQQISCGYGVTGITELPGGTTIAIALRKFVSSHDWSGTGERVYDYAIAHPFIPTPAEKGEFTQGQIDSFSFSQALAAVIGDEIPATVEPAGYLGGGESDCLGTLR
jgi:hypothetical protein